LSALSFSPPSISPSIAAYSSAVWKSSCIYLFLEWKVGGPAYSLPSPFLSISIPRQVRRARTAVSRRPKKIEAVTNEITPTAITGAAAEVTAKSFYSG
jgi:hypothetical protein